jgi:hypothetical protein
MVICAGMYRSCSTWQYMVASELVEKYHEGVRLGFLDNERSIAEIQCVNSLGWHTVKVHNRSHFCSTVLCSERGVGLYAYRDIRDVVYSLMEMWGQSFYELVLTSRTVDRILRNDKFWTCQPQMLVQKFETILGNPIGAVQQIASRLGLELDKTEPVRIAKEYSIDANRRRVEKIAADLRSTEIDLSKPENSRACDPVSLLHWNHIQLSRPGQWKEKATFAECAVLARLCGNWLIHRGYECNLNWATKRTDSFGRR